MFEERTDILKELIDVSTVDEILPDNNKSELNNKINMVIDKQHI